MKAEGTKKEKSFEAALERLEQIVAEMEAGQLKLDAMLKRYEEGMLLARFCSEKLEEAEKKIEMLVKKQDGTLDTLEFAPGEQEKEPACPEATARETVKPEQEGADEDQPLF
jgi:exodeoxyribonuclease VII small subunit